MTKETFVGSVRAALTEKGIPEQFISRQCAILEKKIDGLPADKSETYLVESNASLVAAKLIKNYDGEFAKPDPSDGDPEATVIADIVEDVPRSSEDSGSTVKIDIPAQENASGKGESAVIRDSVKAAGDPTEPRIDSDIVVVFDSDDRKKKRNLVSSIFSSTSNVYADNEHPRLLFALIMVLLAPVCLLLIALGAGIYAAIFSVLAGAIIILVAAVVIVAGGGSLVAVASVLYGITQAISAPRYAGIHEIGFGLIVGGVTLFISILLYNLALRLVPFIYAKLVSLLRFTFKRLKKVFRNSLKGCEKL